MKNLLIFLISLSLVSNSFGQNAVPLEKDKPAPFTGILITNELGNEMRTTTIERDSLVKINVAKDNIIKQQEEIINKQVQQKDILLKQNDNLALRLGEERNMKTWERVGWFTLGIVASGVAMYGLGRIQTR